MASSYTSNSGIQKPGSGEQAGAWGTTVNTNFDIIDRALSGFLDIDLTGLSTKTLTTSDGSISDGHYPVLKLSGTASGTCTVTIDPNDRARLYFVNNGCGETATFTQGSGSSVSVTDGNTAIIYADGGGSTANVVEIKPIPTSGSVGASQIIKDVQTKANSSSVTLSSTAVLTYVKHSGTGTLTINSGQYDGQTINITTTGTMTLSWSAGSQGISLGSSVTLASGVWDDTAGYWFFSETVTS